MADDSRTEVIVEALRSELHTNYAASCVLAGVALSALSDAGYRLVRGPDEPTRLVERLQARQTEINVWRGRCEAAEAELVSLPSRENIARARELAEQLAFDSDTASEIVALLEKPDA